MIRKRGWGWGCMFDYILYLQQYHGEERATLKQQDDRLGPFKKHKLYKLIIS